MSKKEKLAIWGAGGHAEIVADIVRLQGEYEIVCFIDNVNRVEVGATLLNVPILGGDEQLTTLRQEGIEYVIFGIGNCQARLELSKTVQAHGFLLASAIHPKAVVAKDVQVGSGTVIAAGAVINTGTSIGENVIINTSASVDHGCLINDGAHIGPGAHLAGKVTVDRAAWVGIGAIIIDRVRIGAGATIGAGAVVVRDMPDSVIAYGVPARVQRELSAND